MFKYAIALTVSVFILAYAMENTPAKDSAPVEITKPNIPIARDLSLPDDSGRRRVDTVDSVVPREESSTPIKQTAREFDSLAKPIGMWVGNLDTSGIAPWEQIRWEAIDSLTKGGYWLMLDSHFVFKDANCFKWYGKLGITPDVPDTLWVIDTCEEKGCWALIDTTYLDCNELPVDTSIWMDTCDPCQVLEIIRHTHMEDTGTACQRLWYYTDQTNALKRIANPINDGGLYPYGYYYVPISEMRQFVITGNFLNNVNYPIPLNPPYTNTTYPPNSYRGSLVSPSDSFYIPVSVINNYKASYAVSPTFRFYYPPRTDPLSLVYQTYWVPIKVVDTTSGEGGWVAFEDVWPDSLVLSPIYTNNNATFWGPCCADTVQIVDSLQIYPRQPFQVDTLFLEIPQEPCDSGDADTFEVCDSITILVKDTCTLDAITTPGSVTNNIFNTYLSQFITNYFDTSITIINGDTCKPCNEHPTGQDSACMAPRTFDLYCVDSLEVTNIRTFNKTICDTAYFTEVLIQKDSLSIIVYNEDLQKIPQVFDDPAPGSKIICLRKILLPSGQYGYVLDIDVLYGNKPAPTSYSPAHQFICVPYDLIFKWYHFDVDDEYKIDNVIRTTSTEKQRIRVEAIGEVTGDMSLIIDTINCRDTLILERSAKLVTNKTINSTITVDVDTCNPCINLVQTSHGEWFADTLIKDVYDYTEKTSELDTLVPDLVWYRPYTQESTGRAVTLIPPQQTAAEITMINIKASYTVPGASDTLFAGLTSGSLGYDSARNAYYNLLAGIGGPDCRPVRVGRRVMGAGDTLLWLLINGEDLRLGNDTATCHKTFNNQIDCYCIARDSIISLLGRDSVKLTGTYSYGPCNFERAYTSEDSFQVQNCFRDSIVVKYCMPEEVYPSFAVVQVPVWGGCDKLVKSITSYDSTLLYRDTTIVRTFVCDSVSFSVQDTCGPCNPSIKASNGVRSICDTIEIVTPCPNGPKAYWDGKKLVLPYPCDGGTVTINGVTSKTFEGLATDERVRFAFQQSDDRMRDSVQAVRTYSEVLADSLAKVRLDLDSLHVKDTIPNGFWSWENMWKESGSTVYLDDSAKLKLTQSGEVFYNRFIRLGLQDADSIPFAEGTLYYDSYHGTVVMIPEIDGPRLQIGQELWTRVRNTTGVLVPNGAVVKITGTTGHFPEIGLAKASSRDSASILGIVTYDMDDGAYGYVTSFGEVHDLPFSGVVAGQDLFLSTDTAGAMTPVDPGFGHYRIRLGEVTYAHASNGILQVRIEQLGSVRTDDSLSRHRYVIDSLIESVDTLYRWNDAVQSAGRVWGGLITPNGDGTVSVKAGLGWIKVVDAELSTLPLDCGDCDTDSSSAMISKIVEVPWDSVASLALTDSAYNFIYFDGSDSTIKATTDFYSISFYRDFTLGRAYRMGTQVVARLCGTNVWSFDRRVQLAGEELFPVVRAKGVNVSEGSFRSLSVTSGIIWAELVNRFTTTAKSTITDSLTYWYRSGTGWASYKAIAIDSMRYDDGDGTLGTLTINRYGDHWVYVVHDGSVHVVYGRGDYTLANAQAATQPSTLPGLISSYATLRAKIIIQRGSGTFYSIESPDDVRFTTTGVTDHSELSGLQGGTAGQYYHLTTAMYNKIGVDSTKIFAGSNITLTGNAISGYTISSTGGSGGTGLQSLQGLTKQAITLKDTLGILQFTAVAYDSSIQISVHPDTAMKYQRDTSGLGFWNWSQTGIVITDTSALQGILGFDTTKFQGLPEADPVWNSQKANYLLKADSNGIATNYVTLSKLLTEIRDTVKNYATISNLSAYRLVSDTVKPTGTVTWTLVRTEIKDSLNNVVRSEKDPLAVKKADSASYSLGYITFKRLSDSLNANPRVGLDTSGLGFWNWNQAGIVITDTSKLQGILGFDTTKFQGLPEADPVWNSNKPNYVTFSNLFSVQDSLLRAYDSLAAHTDSLLSYSDTLRFIRLDLDSIHVKDTIANGFWNWTQSGLIITDTSKIQGILGFDTTDLQGLPEEDPIWNSNKTNYVTFSNLFGTQDSLLRAYDSLAAHTDSLLSYADTLRFIRMDLDSIHVKDTIANGFWLWSQQGIVISDTSKLQGILGFDTTKLQGLAEADPLAVKKADSANYSLGYITFQRLSDSLNANPRVGLDTSGLGFWSWSQAGVVITDTSKLQGILGFDTTQFQGLPEADPVWNSQKVNYLLKADSNGIENNYITLTKLRVELRDTVKNYATITNLSAYFAKSDSNTMATTRLLKADSNGVETNYMTLSATRSEITSLLAGYVRKNDSSSYETGYITYATLSDTLDANPRGGAGGSALTYTTLSSSAPNIDPSAYSVFLLNGADNTVTADLQDGGVDGMVITIKCINATNTVKFSSSTGVDGGTSQITMALNKSYRLMWVEGGTGWLIISAY